MLLHKIPTKQSDLFLYCVFPVFLTPAPTAPSFRKDQGQKGQKTTAREVAPPTTGLNTADTMKGRILSRHVEIKTQPEFSFTFHNLLLYPHGANLFCGSLRGQSTRWFVSRQVAAGLPGLLLWELTQIICFFTPIFLAP